MKVRWLVALASGAVLVAIACAPTVGPSTTPSPPPSISVSGLGSVTIKPNLAQVSMGVRLTSPPGGDAWQQVANRVDAVIAKLKELGVAEKDIKTSRINASISEPPTGPAKFLAANMVTVKVRDLTKLGAILDGALAAGANRVENLFLTVDDPEALLRQAQEAAMADAKAKADHLAKLAGVKVGKPLRIEEGGFATAFPRGDYRLGMGGEAKTPISPGETEVRVSVSVTYAIE